MLTCVVTEATGLVVLMVLLWHLSTLHSPDTTLQELKNYLVLE